MQPECPKMALGRARCKLLILQDVTRKRKRSYCAMGQTVPHTLCILVTRSVAGYSVVWRARVRMRGETEQNEEWAPAARSGETGARLRPARRRRGNPFGQAHRQSELSGLGDRVSPPRPRSVTSIDALSTFVPDVVSANGVHRAISCDKHFRYPRII